MCVSGCQALLWWSPMHSNRRSNTRHQRSNHRPDHQTAAPLVPSPLLHVCRQGPLPSHGLPALQPTHLPPHVVPDVKHAAVHRVVSEDDVMHVLHGPRIIDPVLVARLVAHNRPRELHLVLPAVGVL